jgi:cytoskeletal protein RodZ
MDEIKNVDDYVNDAETKDLDDDKKKKEKRVRRDYYIELSLFLILGILLGVAIKTEAVKRITIGYNDYKMKTMSQEYDINKMQKDMLAKQVEAAKEAEDNSSAQNPGDGTANADPNAPQAQDNAQDNASSDNNSQNN